MTAGKPVRTSETILAALDDLGAAVDGFSTRINAMEVLLGSVYNRLDRLISIQDRLTDIENSAQILGEKIDVVEERADARAADLRDEICSVSGGIESLPSSLKDEIDGLGYEVRDIAEEIRRSERQEWLMGARDAMGRGRTVKLVM